MTKFMMILAVVVLVGCSSNPSNQIDVPGKGAGDPLGASANESDAALDEAAVIRIAEQAVQANDTWADRAEYSAMKDGDEWIVLVWRIPKVPGGHRSVRIDAAGKVIDYTRGA